MRGKRKWYAWVRPVQGGKYDETIAEADGNMAVSSEPGNVSKT